MKVRRDAAVFLPIQAIIEELDVVAGMAVTSIVELAFPPAEADQRQRNLADNLTDGPRFKNLMPIDVISPEAPDIGVCRINASALPPEALPLSPAKILHSKDRASVGVPVGVMGFPQGLRLPASYESSSEVQMTPLMQTGIVSGVLPFSEVAKPHSLVLDMLINPGSSGSPVFLENGDVIGLVYATRIAFQPLARLSQSREEATGMEAAGVYTPSGLGLAIPSAQFPEQWL